MAARCRAFDWAATPLGPVERWPQSLRTTTGTALATGFPCVVLWGPQLVQIYNDGYAPYLGVKHPRGLGLATRECWPEVWPVNAPIYARVVAGESITVEDQRYPLRRHGPGEPPDDVYLTVSYAPVRDESGAVGGVVVTLVDTTTRVTRERLEVERTLLLEETERARAALAAANAQLQDQALELELSNQQLQEQALELEAQTEALQATAWELEERTAVAEAANAAKSQFLSTMSHELRTPLNAIGGYTELLELGLRGPVTEPQREDLARIRRAGQHLQSLINDILNFARLEAGQVHYDLRELLLDDAVADVEPLLAPQLRERGLTYDHDGCAPDTPERPHRVRADPEKLRQILLNLLTNAVKFTAPGGRVWLTCRQEDAAPAGDGGVVRLHISDTGRGIAAAELGRIFEPFVQVDRHLTTASQQGVGLGLAISRDLARGMGGDLTAESTPGVGSTFTLTLPRAG